ncbi:Phosphoglycolate phosphatase [Candidatus Bilamarchaeum dharawalense]|uniref:Phosphoglycolate phosphatase n=1 Tax=Candidatus Bilamarchaeum dharawalense TaxID=2885759 RepID=A0A5E4LPG9_9ARCH|nr:Phosphoglycolate phosphatase [Candidatus Bilamarchaeum dharawalense]
MLFDFDGVIVQSEPLHRKTFLDLLRPYQVDVSTERWYREFAGTGSRHIFEVLVKEHSINENVDVLVAKRKKNYEEAVQKGELKQTPGVEKFLALLKRKKIKTAIVSGSHRTNVQAALKFFNLAEFFDIIVSGDDLEKRKPDPEPFLYAARKLGLKPDECIAIEDSFSGAEAVIAAGMKLIILRSPAKIPRENAVAVIDNFENIDLDNFL